MYKTDLKSIRVLSILAILAICGLIIVERSQVNVPKPWQTEKRLAAEKMLECTEILREYRLEKGVVVSEEELDPRIAGLLGQNYTVITTDRGSWEAKVSSMNPNFAAVLVSMFKEAGLREGDLVAVAFTGSMPAMNIAVLCASDVLKLQPIIITSVGASEWGANDPDFTWLDMERVLYEKKKISTRSVAASMGGGKDIGRGLSDIGQDALRDAIDRNQVVFIHHDNLEESIVHRMAIYDSVAREVGRPIEAYVNVGGGIASLGSGINQKFIPPGLSKALPRRNFPTKGTLILFAERRIPVIHLLEIEHLASKYGIFSATEEIIPPELFDIGLGDVFRERRYHVGVTIFVTLLLIAAIGFLVWKDFKRHQLP